MTLNPIVFTERVVRSSLRYQLTAYPFADPRLLSQMRRLLSLDETLQSHAFKILRRLTCTTTLHIKTYLKTNTYVYSLTTAFLHSARNERSS